MIEKLKEYFKKRKEIAFAFLFGSYSKGYATPLSDIDIAVYFFPKRRHPIEYEEEVEYPEEDEILTDLTRLLKREVELLVLNRASPSVAASAIRGIPIVINDWGLYLDFMEIVSSESIDFRELLIRDFLEKV